MTAAFTPGPWLMAIIPSSIVGWPIVAPQTGGREICSLRYIDPGDVQMPLAEQKVREFNRETKANGKLIEAAPTMFEALAWIDGEAPAKSVPGYPTVGFQPSRDPDDPDGNDIVREAFEEGVARGLWLAAEKARAALPKVSQS